MGKILDAAFRRPPFVFALVLLMLLQLRAAQRPVVLDPKIQNEPDDDVREMKTRDELARQAEVDETLKPPTAAEREKWRAARWQDFARDIRTFDLLITDLTKFRPDGTYSPQARKTVQRKSRDLSRSVQRILSFLGPKEKPSHAKETPIPADTIEQKTGLLCLLGLRLNPALSRLLTLESQNLSNASLHQKVVDQLRLIALVSKRIRD